MILALIDRIRALPGVPMNTFARVLFLFTGLLVLVSSIGWALGWRSSTRMRDSAAPVTVSDQTDFATQEQNERLRELLDKQGKTAKQFAPPKEPEGPVGEPDFVVTATDFYEEHRTNRKAAEAEYQGKVIELSGFVLLAGRHEDGIRGVIMFGSNVNPGYGFTCRCTVADRTIGAKLGRGQFVRVVGRYYRALLWPELVPCEIVEKGPDTRIPITAELLAKEFTSDPEACIEKYSDRTLSVVGTVSAIRKEPKMQLHYIELRGDSRTTIQCQFGDGFDVGSYKVGDRATFVGHPVAISELGEGRLTLVFCEPIDR